MMENRTSPFMEKMRRVQHQELMVGIQDPRLIESAQRMDLSGSEMLCFLSGYLGRRPSFRLNQGAMKRCDKKSLIFKPGMSHL